MIICGGTLAHVSAQTAEIGNLRWHNAPKRAFLHGFIWTVRHGITLKQLAMLGRCTLLTVTTPDGKDFTKVPISVVPFHSALAPTLFEVMHPMHPMHPDRKAILLEGSWRADKWRYAVSFYDDPGNLELGLRPMVWKTFPGETWIRVDIIGLSDGDRNGL